MTNLLYILSNIHTYEAYEKSKSLIAEDLALAVIQKHQLPDAPISLMTEGTNIVFSHLDQIIKIFPPCHQSQFESDRLVLKHLDEKISIKTPKLHYEGEIFGWPYLIMSYLDGTLLETLWETMAHSNKLIIMQELGALIREVHALPVTGLKSIDSHWPEFVKKQISNCVANHREKGLSENLLQELPNYIADIQDDLLKITKPVLLTGEYTPMNFLVKKENDVWHIHGLIDFGDAMLGKADYDLLGPAAFLIQGDKVLLKTFLLAYGYLESDLTETFSHQMTALMLLHQYSNLKVQVRIAGWEEQVKSLEQLTQLVWSI